MKFLSLTLLTATQVSTTSANCGSIVADAAPESLGVKVTYVNEVPVAVTAVSGVGVFYNSMVFEKIHGETIFVDNSLGVVWAHDDGPNNFKEIYDINTDDVPVGVDFNIPAPYVAFASGRKPVQSISEGPNKDEYIVVFTSSTLPAGATALPLPSASEYHLEDEGDCSDANATCSGRASPFDGPGCCLASTVSFHCIESIALSVSLVSPTYHYHCLST